MNNVHFLTAEAVRAGHPDKLCDQIADRVLDAHLSRDPNARVAIEVFATDGKILVAGEVTSKTTVSYKTIIWDTLRGVGYDKHDLCSGNIPNIDIEICMHEQSPGISQAIGDGEEQGAGDQGIMVGYATDETPEYLPMPVVLAQSLCRELDKLKSKVKWLGVDGKVQVTVAYENGVPKAVTDIVISVQHSKDACPDCMYRAIVGELVPRVIPDYLLKMNTQILLNPSGRFILGGPVADTGLTGRKLAVDQYGAAAHIAGGALSGKDCTKVDRSGAYAARWVAKNIVAAGLAKRCEVQIAYAIGVAKPVCVTVDTFGTGIVQDNALSLAVKDVFDLRPAAIIKRLNLRAPIYTPLAVYGHYGRPELDLPWERTSMKSALISELIKMGCEV